MKQLPQVYENIHPKVYSFFLMKTLNKEEAEDLTQEVFYQALRSFNAFKGKSSLTTWIFSIAYNVLKKHYRKNAYEHKLIANLSTTIKESYISEDKLIKKETQVTLINAINSLDDLPRDIVLLRVYSELSFKEIGTLLNKSENYVRVTFYRSKLKIKDILEGIYEY